MIALRAFVITDNFSFWSTVWRGDSLRDLSQEDFSYFKDIYTVKNLKLAYIYDYDDDDYYNYDDDDFSYSC